MQSFNMSVFYSPIYVIIVYWFVSCDIMYTITNLLDIWNSLKVFEKYRDIYIKMDVIG